jgi:ectoine hydroxylase-related dioxygenase (phytanoyl-CoA dioxygenase family)
MTRIDCRQIAEAELEQCEEVRLACEGIVKQGYVILDHVVDANRASALNAEFRSRYADYLQDSERDDTLEVGHRRYMMAVELAGGFADCEVYANRIIVAVARRLLGADAILESYGAVVSLSGAKQQHLHRDGLQLFDAQLSPLLPCHALTLAMPLVDMNQTNGSTALWPGSHRWRVRDENVAPVAPEIPAGSCMLWDFRLYHAGAANRSADHRPMLYATYARRWYCDPANFSKKGQRRLVCGEAFLAGVPADRRPLFDHLPDCPPPASPGRG